MFPFHRQIRQRLSETDKENHVYFALLREEKLEESPSSLKRTMFWLV